MACADSERRRSWCCQPSAAAREWAEGVVRLSRAAGLWCFGVWRAWGSSRNAPHAAGLPAPARGTGGPRLAVTARTGQGWGFCTVRHGARLGAARGRPGSPAPGAEPCVTAETAALGGGRACGLRRRGLGVEGRGLLLLLLLLLAGAPAAALGCCRELVTVVLAWDSVGCR